MKIGKLLLIIVLVAAFVAAVVFIAGNYGGESAAHEESPVRINEVMSSNKGSIPDDYGDYPDWVELYNTSDEAAEIGGYGLTDELTSGAKYVFPSGTVIEPHGYLLVWCSGEERDNYHASFKLSASDELIFYNSTGAMLDSVALRAVAAGASLGISDDGMAQWSEMAKPSPGFPNTEAGAAEFEKTLLETEDIGVHISEFMASNASTIADGSGEFSDWIELHNETAEDVDISGCGISDNISQPQKYALPEGTVIPAGGYLLIFCSGAETAEGGTELHAPFGLRAYGEDVVFSSKNGRIIDSCTYERAQSDISFVRSGDGFTASAQPTPGYENTDAGYQTFIEETAAAVGDLMLSEMIGLNNSVKKAADGETCDYIELYNAGSEAISLLGCGLTNNSNNPAKWTFPDITIGPGEYLLVYASGRNAAQAGAELHTNYSISGEGESVFLFDAEGALLDKLCPSGFLPDVSYGRDSAGKLCYFTEPTPGAANGSGMAGITHAPEFTLTPGIYEGTVSVGFKEREGESIYYTTDCTDPASSPTRTLYAGALSLSQNTVVRAVAQRQGYATGYAQSGTYLFKSDGVNHALPVVTLVCEPSDLWDGKTGIYAFGDGYQGYYGEADKYGDSLESANFYQGKGSDAAQEAWSRMAAFEVFSDEGVRVFSQTVDIRIAGSFGRGRAQKGFNVSANGQYGKSTMEYAFFDNREYTQYKDLVLRAGGQDQSYGKIRDELATGLMEGAGVNMLYQAYKPYVLYLNGEYWGVYFMKEKRNRFFVAQHEGLSFDQSADVDLIKSAKTVYNGSGADWAKLMEYVSANGARSDSAYAYISERVDIDSFIDYEITEIYSANSDVWNIQYYRVPGGKWKWIYYDFCWSFGASSGKENHPTLARRRASDVPCSDLFNALLENSAFKDKFVRRFAQLLSTAYTPERVTALIDELYAAVEPEMKREREKFNSEYFMGVKQREEGLGTYDKFIDQIEEIREFAQKRPDALKAQLESELSLSDSYMKEVFGE